MLKKYHGLWIVLIKSAQCWTIKHTVRVNVEVASMSTSLTLVKGIAFLHFCRLAFLLFDYDCWCLCIVGINYEHCEFGGRAQYPGYDPVDNYNNISTKRFGIDCQGHGTHVASLAVGNISGLSRCATAYSVRVLDCNGRAPWGVIVDGMNYAATKIGQTRRPSVVSMSLGGSYSSTVNQVATNIINKGIPIVVSAGNDRRSACSKSPASTPGAITVGGTARGDGIYFNTNAGPCVDILAPGASVVAASHRCNACTCTRSLSGTSMAAPLVSGAVALLLEKEPSLSPANITKRLQQNCIKDAISFTFLPSRYKNNTINCLLHVKKCKS